VRIEAITPRRPRLFYGWVLVLLTAVRGSINVGSYFVNSALVVPMQAELGWSRPLLFGVLTVRNLLMGAISPFVGPIGDHRWLPKLVFPVSTVLLGVSMMTVKWVQAPWEFYLLQGVVGAVGMALTGNAVLNGLIAKWFVRKRAKAIMWTNVGPGTGPLIFPPIVAALVIMVGWRDTWFWMGVITTLLLAPLSFIAHTRPEDTGTGPDGDPIGHVAGAAGRGTPGIRATASFTRPQAVRTRAFWLISTAGALATFGVQGYQVQWLPYLIGDRGFSQQTGANGVLVYGVFTVCARFFWGFWSSRYATRYVLLAQGLAAGVGVLFFMTVQSTPMLFAWAVWQGLCLAGFFQLQALLLMDYFGREHLGAITGFVLPLSTVSSASAPLLLSLLRDVTGTYTLAFGIVAAGWIGCALLCGVTAQPRPRSSSTTAGAT